MKNKNKVDMKNKNKALEEIEIPNESDLDLKNVLYCIENKVTGDKYVGVSTREFRKRLIQHLTLHSKQKSSATDGRTPLYTDLNKYGPKIFKAYVIEQNDDYDYVKIGYSNEPEKRFIQLDVGANPLYLISEYEGKTRGYIKNLESKLHGLLKEFRYRNEWFKLNKDQLIALDDFIVNFCEVKPHYYNKEFFIKTFQDSIIK